MQTFITDFDMKKTAANLDDKRLGKQRVEALQIAACLLVKPTRWKNHPAVKMWQGYEIFLLKVYIPAMIEEWHINRGFNSENCIEKLSWLQKRYVNKRSNILIPPWITKEFIKAHRSNLIRKKPEYYKRKWPKVPNNLEYIWPTK